MSATRFDVRGAAEYIGMSSAFLNRRRVTGNGPAYLKLGGRIFYPQSDLDAWLQGQRRISTSANGSPPQLEAAA